MAVVLQVMVEADWSGVGFTIDPERRSAGMRIEVVPGLGEALVSGRLTPSDYTVDRETLEIQVTGDAEPPDFLEDLARMLLHVEDRLDAPQDVEWSTANGSITLLQARPITVVGPTTAEDDGFDGPVGTRDTFTPRGVVEMLPDVVPPLLWTINGPMIEDAFRKVIDSLGAAGGAPDRQFVGRFRGRAALDLSLLQEIAALEQIDLEQVVAVGDGANDLPMLGLAGLGIAFHAKPVVRATARQSISTIGLDGILYLLGLRDFETDDGGA